MSERKKILVVDDSDLVAGMLTELLENSGYRIVRAVNGLEGVLKVYSEIPDLIIMDVEMPVLQGYQAGRLLKARRGVKDIPLVMHTSLSEDRDQFWALSSGADAFITKDFDNLNPLLETIKSLTAGKEIDRSVIKEDAARVDSDYVIEMLGSTLDNHLFQSVILNKLSESACSIKSLSGTAEGVLGLIDRVCTVDIAVIILKYENEVTAFVKRAPGTGKAEAEDFFNICVSDFLKAFPDAPGDGVKAEYFDSGAPEKGQEGAIRSYSYWTIPGHCGPVGTIHAGSKTNNYFSEVIDCSLKVFTGGAGSLLENAMLMKNITSMERNIRNVFSKFVPAEIINDLAGKSGSLSLTAGEKRNVAVLFTDIRSFTEISEKNRPEDVVAFLNRYFETMAGAVIKHGGTVDKFIGDAILAVFGAPKAWDNNAERAVSAAFDMLRSLKEIDTGTLIMPDGGLDMGIGIHQGDAIVGNIGSKERFDYTVIGDTVNLASRLEGLTKYYNSHIIVSDNVRECLKERVTFREVDRVKVKGRDLTTTIYKLENVTRNRFSPEALADYEKALSMFRIQNWETASEFFRKVLEHVPGDFLSEMYVKRCHDFIKNPVPSDWDGTLKLEVK